jgi:uncharacterized protein YndB with AHSA1/START domain
VSIIKPLGGEVTVRIDAPVAEVWALVSDVTRIGEFSPETFEAKWTQGSTGPEVGATFAGHVKRNGVGPTYWAACRVTRCVENEVFEFGVGLQGTTINNWGYRLAPAGAGGADGADGADGASTDVTEYFRLETTVLNRLYWLLLGRLRGRTNERGMRTTLERMKAVLEA